MQSVKKKECKGQYLFLFKCETGKLKVNVRISKLESEKIKITIYFQRTYDTRRPNNEIQKEFIEFIYFEGSYRIYIFPNILRNDGTIERGRVKGKRESGKLASIVNSRKKQQKS